jgi:hypothetical protein
MPYHKHYALVALMLALSAQHVSLAKTSYDQLVVADVITLRDNEVGALKRLAAFMVDQHLEAPQGLKVRLYPKIQVIRISTMAEAN